MLENKPYEEYPVTEYENFREMLDGCGENYGTRPLFREKAPVGIRETYPAEFSDMVNRLGAAFLEYELLDGAKIAVIGETSVKWIAAYFAAVCGGGVIVPIDRELPVDEIAYIINDSETKAIVYSSAMHDEMIQLEQYVPGVQCFIGMDGPGDGAEGKWHSFDVFTKNVNAESMRRYKAIPQDSDTISAILYTSGTTGQSKGVMLCQRNILCSAIGGLKMYRVGETCMSVLPIHHVLEMTQGIVGMLINGTTICINDSLRYFMQNLELYKPEFILIVPAYAEMLYKRIWAKVRTDGKEQHLNDLIGQSNAMLLSGIDQRCEFFGFIRDLFGGKLDVLICGGAPLDPMYVKFFREIGILLIQGYGLTETSPLVSVNRNKYIVDASIGAPIYCCEVKILNESENGEGEISVKGDQVMLGYYKNPKATNEVFDNGWFRTGDIGRIDEAGLLYITGRKKNIIILSNGKNVYPEEIEGYYMRIPYVHEIVVRAIDDGNQEQLFAEVFLDEAFREKFGDEESLKILERDMAEINKKLPPYKQVHSAILRDTEFEKTTKKSIKRHGQHTNS